MEKEKLEFLLQAVAKGDISVSEAGDKLADLPYADLGFANVDHHRALRNGFPEVVFAQGKTAEQVAAIFIELSRKTTPVLASRVSPEQAVQVQSIIPGLSYDASARVLSLGDFPAPDTSLGTVALLTAGTADWPVAEEAAVFLKAAAIAVNRLNDVGVAGLHRLLSRRQDLRQAATIIVVAGMDGALPSVVAGLVDCPVIAVPSSIGYGASFGGVAALLTMLNSCSAGLTVVNIDNGFGAAMAALRILAKAPKGNVLAGISR